MTPEFWYTALALLVAFIILSRIICIPVRNEYIKAIVKPEKEIKLREGERAAVNLLNAIRDAAKEQHPDISRYGDDWKEFNFYFDEAVKGHNLGLLICLAHELGCEIVLRRISEEDIEDEKNRGDAFWEYLCDEKERFFKDWEPEFKNRSKWKK